MLPRLYIDKWGKFKLNMWDILSTRQETQLELCNNSYNSEIVSFTLNFRKDPAVKVNLVDRLWICNSAEWKLSIFLFRSLLQIPKSWKLNLISQCSVNVWSPFSLATSGMASFFKDGFISASEKRKIAEQILTIKILKDGKDLNFFLQNFSGICWLHYFIIKRSYDIFSQISLCIKP